MLKKFWLLALSTIVLWSPLLSIASAADYTFTSSSYTDWVYSPNFFTLSSSSVIDSISYTEHSSQYGAICVCNSLEEDCSYDYEWTNDNLLCSFNTDSNENSCENKSLSAWTYYVGPCTDQSFASVTLNISSSSSWGSDSDWSIGIPSWFTDSVNWLVSNFAWSFWNYAPTLILVWLGVVLLFTFWWIIRSWAVRIFNRRWK